MGYNGSKQGFDGIPVGTIRETYSDIPAERWCKCFGHKVRTYGDGRYCQVCDKPESECVNDDIKLLEKREADNS